MRAWDLAGAIGKRIEFQVEDEWVGGLLTDVIEKKQKDGWEVSVYVGENFATQEWFVISEDSAFAFGLDGPR